MPIVIVSDGEGLEVRTLGIFELDEIPRNFLGPFTFKMKILGGNEREVEYDIAKYDELDRPLPKPSPRPENEIKENSQEWYEHRDWQLYQAAILHNRRRYEAVSDYLDNVVVYILSNCISRQDINRIVTETDWEKVYKAAMIPQVTERLIIETLKNTYQAEYNDQEVFAALNKVGGGGGMYNAIRLWENEWANEMSLTDAELAIIPVEERARRICAKFLNKWFEVLEIARMRKERSSAID